MGRKVENLDLVMSDETSEACSLYTFLYAYRDIIHIAKLPQEKFRLTLISAHILTVTGTCDRQNVSRNYKKTHFDQSERLGSRQNYVIFFVLLLRFSSCSSELLRPKSRHLNFNFTARTGKGTQI